MDTKILLMLTIFFIFYCNCLPYSGYRRLPTDDAFDDNEEDIVPFKPFNPNYEVKLILKCIFKKVNFLFILTKKNLLYKYKKFK